MKKSFKLKFLSIFNVTRYHVPVLIVLLCYCGTLHIALSAAYGQHESYTYEVVQKSMPQHTAATYHNMSNTIHNKDTVHYMRTAAIHNPATAPSPKKQYTLILPDDHVIGCNTAPNVLIHYVSLNCIHCTIWHMLNFSTLKRNYIDTCKIKYVLRELPISRISLVASKYLECSTQFFKTFDVLSASQLNWIQNKKQAEIIEKIIIAQHNDDRDKIRQCVASQRVINTVKTHMTYAISQMDVHVLPTFFINGKKLEGMTKLEKITRH